MGDVVAEYRRRRAELGPSGRPPDRVAEFVAGLRADGVVTREHAWERLRDHMAAGSLSESEKAVILAEFPSEEAFLAQADKVLLDVQVPMAYLLQVARVLAASYRNNAASYPADADHWEAMAKGAENVAQMVAETAQVNLNPR